MISHALVSAASILIGVYIGCRYDVYLVRLTFWIEERSGKRRAADASDVRAEVPQRKAG